jgi:hypothetical protein
MFPEKFKLFKLIKPFNFFNRITRSSTMQTPDGEAPSSYPIWTQSDGLRTT